MELAKEATIESQLRMSLLSAMETGNHGRARTILRELADVDVKLAQALRIDVVSAYGIAL